MHAIEPANYAQQLQDKLRDLKALFRGVDMPNIAVFESEPLHFRMRGEFKAWHQDDTVRYAMYRPGQRSQPYVIDEFVIGSPRLCALMPLLLVQLNAEPVLRERLFAIEFLTTHSGEALVTLIYHRPLNREWEACAHRLHHLLDASIVGRSRKQKVVIGRDFVMEELTVSGRSYRFQQIENGFTQPNAGVNQKMLTWALAQSRALGGDLLELYCGNGNFTVVLAQNFARVLATEIATVSANAARHNLAINNVDNTVVVRMASAEIAAALSGEREFRRLQTIDINSYSFSTVFVDPPRAGLDRETVNLVRQFDNILYISCNPETLKNNLLALADTHAVDSFAVFDQFPYTTHLECGALLRRTDGK